MYYSSCGRKVPVYGEGNSSDYRNIVAIFIRQS